MTSHFIAYDAPAIRGSLRTALCGQRVTASSHSATPTCETCARELAGDTDSLLSIQQTPAHEFGPPVKHEDFNPTAGYRKRRLA